VASQLLRNLKLTIEYDGTDFHGWQAQENVRTVEGVLSQALQGLLKEGAELHAASRTDQGVHARGQVVSFLTTTRIPAGRFPAALNGMLPWDVRVRKAEEADPAFNARFSAVGKHYRYRLDRGETDSPFLSRFALHYPGRLDVKAMREAARLMAGTHDFASFQCVSKRRLASTVRTVYDVRVGEEGRFLWFDVWGKSFLYKMVRTMAGTLLEVGRGKWSPERIPALLSSVSRAAAGPTCPGNGLCLMAVYYDLDRLEGALQGSSPVPSELGPPLEGEGGGGKG
jgi:tRNA pseudouridine38-40 synthase